MSGWAVRVHVVDEDDDPKGQDSLIGPFRSRERAIEVQGKVGSRAGLNLNNHGWWAGTDGGTKFATVTVVPFYSPQDHEKAANAVRAWFTEESEPN